MLGKRICNASCARLCCLTTYKSKDKAYQEQVRKKRNNTKRRMSRGDEESSDGNDGRLSSHDFTLLSSRGHVLPPAKSEAVKVTDTKHNRKYECMHSHLLVNSHQDLMLLCNVFMGCVNQYLDLTEIYQKRFFFFFAF